MEIIGIPPRILFSTKWYMSTSFISCRSTRDILRAALKSHVNTLQCILPVVGAKCKVSFDVPNSLASVLGFKLHCKIHSSYKRVRGTQAPVAYNFFQNAAPGQKILEAPHNLIYLPVTVDVISTLSVWLTDQYGKQYVCTV